MKQCPDCGKYVSDSAKFCDNCGHLFGVSNGMHESIPNDRNNFKQIDNNGKKENNRKTIYGVILLVIFLIAGYWVYTEFGSQSHIDQRNAENIIGVWKSEDTEDKEETIKMFLNFSSADNSSTSGTLVIKVLINENTTTEEGTPYSGTFILTENGNWNIKDGQLTISGSPETRKVTPANFDYNVVSAKSVQEIAANLKLRKFSGGFLEGTITSKIESIGDDGLIVIDSDNDRVGFDKSSTQEFNQVQPQDNASALQEEQDAVDAQREAQRTRMINTWENRFVGCSYCEITDEPTDYFVSAFFGSPDADGNGVGVLSYGVDDESTFSYAIIDADKVKCTLKDGSSFFLQYTSNGIILDEYQVNHKQDDRYNYYFEY